MVPYIPKVGLLRGGKTADTRPVKKGFGKGEGGGVKGTVPDRKGGLGKRERSGTYRSGREHQRNGVSPESLGRTRGDETRQFDVREKGKKNGGGNEVFREGCTAEAGLKNR